MRKSLTFSWFLRNALPSIVLSTDDENSENRKENIEDRHGKQKDDNLKGTLFSRIEESRQALEEELGFDMFMKIYKHVQVAFYWFISVAS